MKSKPEANILLASASSRRADLLRQINVVPRKIIAPNIDEAQNKGESPQALVKRLSLEKARTVFNENKNSFVLAADTVVACGKNILDKAENHEQAIENLTKLSGRRHRVYGGISLITPQNQELTRLCTTIIQFKPLSAREIEEYVNAGEWKGKAGSYAIQGYAGAFVKFLSGSYSNVVGLSLYDTIKILESGGIAPAPTNSEE